MTWPLDPPATRQQRHQMVQEQLVGRQVRDGRVLAAMARLPRERFVPPEIAADAYDDGAQAIGMGQTISQPYMVAVMAELLCLEGEENVLEVGAGSGYGAAVLSLLARQVVAVERIPQLLATAQLRWQALGLHNVVGITGDGAHGCSQYAPFDAISVTAAAPSPPRSLIAQLKPHSGRMVIPVGSRRHQMLLLIRRGIDPDHFTVEEQFPCVFVPLISDEGWTT